MKNFLILLIGALIAVSCVKQADFDEYQDHQDLIVKNLQQQINGLTEALAQSTSDLQAAIDATDGNVATNAEAINAANEAIANNLELIGQVSSTLTTELSNVYAELEVAELELVELISDKVDELEDAIQAGDEDVLLTLDVTTTLLREEIDAAQAAAQAYADANDQVGGYDDSTLVSSISDVDAALQVVENDYVTHGELDAAIRTIELKAGPQGETGTVTITVTNTETVVDVQIVTETVTETLTVTNTVTIDNTKTVSNAEFNSDGDVVLTYDDGSTLLVDVPEQELPEGTPGWHFPETWAGVDDGGSWDRLTWTSPYLEGASIYTTNEDYDLRGSVIVNGSVVYEYDTINVADGISWLIDNYDPEEDATPTTIDWTITTTTSVTYEDTSSVGIQADNGYFIELLTNNSTGVATGFRIYDSSSSIIRTDAIGTYTTHNETVDSAKAYVETFATTRYFFNFELLNEQDGVTYEVRADDGTVIVSGDDITSFYTSGSSALSLWVNGERTTPALVSFNVEEIEHSGSASRRLIGT